MSRLRHNRNNIIFSAVTATISLFIIPTVLSYLVKPNWAENVLIGTSFFLVSEICLISYNTSNVKNTVNNKTLRNIAKHYEELDKTTKNTLFIKWYTKEFTKLETKIKNTLTDEYITFPVCRLPDKNNLIYSVFNEKNGDFFHASCTCEGIKWWFDYDGKWFIENLHKRVENKNITRIRRIFIYDDKDIINDMTDNTTTFHPIVQFCLALHQNGEYEFKLIKRGKYNDRFRKEKSTHEIDHISPDFGIYGNNYVWETLDADESDFLERGRFSKKKETVEHYQRFFNNLWADKNIQTNSVAPHTIKSEIMTICKGKNITELQELYEAYKANKKKAIRKIKIFKKPLDKT